MKKYTKIWLTVLLLLLLSGCSKVQVNFTVDDDGSVSSSGYIYIPTAIMDSRQQRVLLESNDEVIGLFKNYKMETTVISDTEYSGMTFTLNDEFNSIYTKTNANFFTIECEINTADFKEKVNNLPISSDTTENKSFDLNTLKSYGLEANMSIEMPGPVLENNFGNKNGNTISIDLTEALGETIVAKSLILSHCILVGVGGVLVILLVVYVIVKREPKEDDKTNMNA